MIDCKVVVFGAGGVGKSALTVQFVQGYFISDYDPTIEDSYKRVLAVDNEKVQLDILDTAGQDDFAPMRVSYMRQGKAFVIVYSIDDRSSFEAVQEIYNEIVRTKGTKNIPIVICGNKSDLVDKRVVSKVEGQELAHDLGAIFYETSAFLNENITEAFTALVKNVMKSVSSSQNQNANKQIQKKKKKIMACCNLI
ncbi:small GTP-binding protein [Histomonas meleagridis]|uniref:small GTP-binding protein n=1 Tax=Histomonas meleagridis TaxID=135588 RepID=UPI0035597C01|nr:small GTP-binding protein [Histomonas meleagridis]KAH0804315.1 small GTP-binding protein [Histomonas meleagridis]